MSPKKRVILLNAALAASLLLAAAPPASAKSGAEPKRFGEISPRSLPRGMDSDKTDLATIEKALREAPEELKKLGSVAERLGSASEAYRQNPSDENFGVLLEMMVLSGKAGRTACNNVADRAEAIRQVNERLASQVGESLSIVQRFSAPRRAEAERLDSSNARLRSGISDLAKAVGSQGFESDADIPEPLRRKIASSLRALGMSESAFKMTRWTTNELAKAERKLMSAHSRLRDNSIRLGDVATDYRVLADNFAMAAEETAIVTEAHTRSRQFELANKQLNEFTVRITAASDGISKILGDMAPDIVLSAESEAEAEPDRPKDRSLLDALQKYGR